MSYLLKQNKILKPFLTYFFYSFLFFLFVIGYNNYIGNKFVYLLFSFISNFSLIYSFRSKAIFFDNFIGSFLWLGFYFKLVVINSFFSSNFVEGSGYFDYSPIFYDRTLIISTVGIFAVIMSSYFRELFYNYKNKKYSYSPNNYKYIVSLYLKKKKLVLLFYFLIILIVSLLNFNYHIYQKGLILKNDINFLMSNIIKWLLLFGFTSFSCFIIYFELLHFKKNKILIFFISFFELFCSYTSMLSRGMIFSSSSIIYGFYKFNKFNKLKEKSTFLCKLIIISLTFFYFSLLLTNHFRNSYIKGNQNLVVIENFKKINNEIIYLSINRWVGIDAVMSVASLPQKLNFNLLVNSFKEVPNIYGKSFYEETFQNMNNNNFFSKDSRIEDSKVVVIKGNTLPGFIAFFYYSGSLIFLFFSIFFLCIILSFLEVLSFIYSKYNFLFAALVGQILAYRLIHLGYLPSNSYALICALTINIFIFKIIFRENK